jgi:hypothetical protein
MASLSSTADVKSVDMTEPPDHEPRVKTGKINTASATIIAAVIGLVGVVITTFIAHGVQATGAPTQQPPSPQSSPTPITTASPASPIFPSSANREPPIGEALETPLLADLDDTLVARDGVPNVSDTTVSINGHKAKKSFRVGPVRLESASSAMS